MRFETYFKENNIIDSDNADEVFSFIKSQPVKYKILSKNIYIDKIYDNGFDTAINNTVILKFYLEQLRKNKKTSSIIYVPEKIDYKVYDKLNDILKFGETCEFKEDYVKKFNRLYIFTIFAGLLYETYFGDKILTYASLHDEINKLKIPTSCEEYFKVFDELYNKDGKIRHAIFFADTVPVIRTIESNLR